MLLKMLKYPLPMLTWGGGGEWAKWVGSKNPNRSQSCLPTSVRPTAILTKRKVRSNKYASTTESSVHWTIAKKESIVLPSFGLCLFPFVGWSLLSFFIEILVHGRCRRKTQSPKQSPERQLRQNRSYRSGLCGIHRTSAAAN